MYTACRSQLYAGPDPNIPNLSSNEKPQCSAFSVEQRVYAARPLSDKLMALPAQRIAPMWAADSSSDNCFVCGKRFTFFFRRHHCRNCGQLVCNDCSPRGLILSQKDTVPSRVCSPCGGRLLASKSAIAAEDAILGGKQQMSFFSNCAIS